MKLINKRNGKRLKVGSTVNLDGDKCVIYKIEGTNIGLERVDGHVSWDMVDPDAFGARWDEADFVNHFFNEREKHLSLWG